VRELIGAGKVGHFGMSEAAPPHNPPRPRRRVRTAEACSRAGGVLGAVHAQVRGAQRRAEIAGRVQR
jgi:hypothetical protein